MEESAKVLIVIPTYNEVDNVGKLLPAILALGVPNLEVLVVDDASPDGTGRIVEQLAGRDRRVHLLSRPGKTGLGAAYVAGFKYALEHDYDYILEMDADFSHDPKEIPNLLKRAGDCDLVIGSRYITGVNVVNWPLRRLMLSMGASLYTRMITGMKIRDCTSGFKCFKRRLLEAIDLDAIHSDGYSFQIEVNFKACKKGFKACEIPIIFVDRVIGSSKMSKKIIREAMWIVWKLRLLQIMGKL